MSMYIYIYIYIYIYKFNTYCCTIVQMTILKTSPLYNFNCQPIYTVCLYIHPTKQ